MELTKANLGLWLRAWASWLLNGVLNNCVLERWRHL